MAYLTTLHDLIKELETHSSIIGSMGLARQLQDCPLTNDLRVFANQDGEKALVRFALDRLVELQLLTVADAEINIRQLLQGTNFYGGFFELAT